MLTTPRIIHALLIAALACALSGCGGEPRGEFPIHAPADVVHGILRSEAAAQLCQERVTAHLQGSLLDALSADFVARFCVLTGGVVIADELLTIKVFDGTDGALLPGENFVERLSLFTHDWSEVVIAEFELDEFLLDTSGKRAAGRAELYLAGERKTGGRADFRAICEVDFERQDGANWLLRRLDLVRATSIVSEFSRFLDVSDATGLHQNVSDENAAMLQAYVDEHRTLSLGGLSAVDWNEDGSWDLLATLDDEISTLFLNDGEGGFVPAKLPPSAPHENGISLLHVDLDGDGVRELVSSKVGSYDGDRASAGLYHLEDGQWVLDPLAFTFENPIGLRGVSPTTVVPIDVNGDGLLDLFFGVYGTNSSRGENYNLVESHDGADNYLFINKGNLTFVEESELRGISGVQYTYVALPLDFDGDGDEDLFEGNDFGPNTLWLNDGSGHFRADEDSVFAGKSAYTMGVSLADHDDDGNLSLYVVNMSSEAGKRVSRIADGISEGMRQRIWTIADGNMLYTQDGDGDWIEVTSGSGTAEGEWGWGALFADVDGDGDDEIFATNGFTSHSNADLGDWDTYFWRQVATDGALLERGEKTHDINVDLRFEGSYAGRQRDRLFYAPSGDPDCFVDAAWHFGLDSSLDGRCVVFVDVDGDGDLDLVKWTLKGLQLLENRSPKQHFLRLKLTATKGHPHALGARVALSSAGKTQYDIVQMVEGFQTQVPLELHFSLATGERIDSIEVTWRSGVKEEWLDLPPDSLIRLTEGEENWVSEEVPIWTQDGLSLFELQELGRSHSPGVNQEKLLVLRLAAEEQTATSRALDVELRYVVDKQHSGTTFVFNLNGELRRAYRTEPASEALDALLETLRDEEPFPELSVLTGRRLVLENKLEEALGYFERALEQAPNLATAAEGIARSQRLLGRMEESQIAYERSVEIDPDYAIGHFNLAVLHARAGRGPEALSAYRETLRIRGEDFDTLIAYGEVATIVGERELAIKVFERAALADLDSALPHVMLGKVFGQLKRYELAKAAFEQALEIRPTNVEAQRGLQLLERLIAGSR
ncbi:MAG: tetratricopeptide (TPR) repeat protein [Planctomycetota bacterium]